MMIGFGLLGGKAAAVVRASLSRFGAIGTGRRKPTTERPKGSHSHRRRRRRLRLLQSLASWCRACRARPERGVGKTLGVGQRGASKAPGRLGRWLRKPFDTSQRAKSKSASAGRRGRGKLPLSAFGAARGLVGLRCQNGGSARRRSWPG
jgi:hypothetical protein